MAHCRNLLAINFLRGAADAETVLACARECPHLRGLVLRCSRVARPSHSPSTALRCHLELKYLKFCNLYVNYATSWRRSRTWVAVPRNRKYLRHGIHHPALADRILASPALQRRAPKNPRVRSCVGRRGRVAVGERCSRSIRSVMKVLARVLNGTLRSVPTIQPNEFLNAAGGGSDSVSKNICRGRDSTDRSGYSKTRCHRFGTLRTD